MAVQLEFKVGDFEGPLDLLLFLISKHKLNINDIEISELLTQYLDAIEQMQSADLELKSEFLEMRRACLHQNCFAAAEARGSGRTEKRAGRTAFRVPALPRNSGKAGAHGEGSPRLCTCPHENQAGSHLSGQPRAGRAHGGLSDGGG